MAISNAQQSEDPALEEQRQQEAGDRAAKDENMNNVTTKKNHELDAWTEVLADPEPPKLPKPAKPPKQPKLSKKRHRVSERIREAQEAEEERQAEQRAQLTERSPELGSSPRPPTPKVSPAVEASFKISDGSEDSYYHAEANYNQADKSVSVAQHTLRPDSRRRKSPGDCQETENTRDDSSAAPPSADEVDDVRPKKKKKKKRMGSQDLEPSSSTAENRPVTNENCPKTPTTSITSKKIDSSQEGEVQQSANPPGDRDRRFKLHPPAPVTVELSRHTRLTRNTSLVDYIDSDEEGKGGPAKKKRCKSTKPPDRSLEPSKAGETEESSALDDTTQQQSEVHQPVAASVDRGNERERDDGRRATRKRRAPSSVPECTPTPGGKNCKHLLPIRDVTKDGEGPAKRQRVREANKMHCNFCGEEFLCYFGTQVFHIGPYHHGTFAIE